MAEVFEQVTGFPAAIRELGARGLIRVTGGDRIHFLNGMLTSEVESLEAGAVRAALQLDRKGHIRAELWLVVLDEAVLLDAAPGAEAALFETLDKHVIAEDVELERLSGWDQLGIEGPGASALETARSPAPGRCEVDARGRLWLAGGSVAGQGVRVLGERAAIAELRVRLDLPSLSEEAALVLRIDAFRPAQGVDFGERNFPQEAGLEDSVSFTKGCFIGQEIVARIESRGAVNRLLVKLRPETTVARGAEIRADGKSVGQVTSAAASAATGPIALGYVHAALAEPGTAVEIAGVPASVLPRSASSRSDK
ncbi:MAG: glycine cleavage T C-terminal barrel domain-containing protein [Myxococcota bacterium]